MERETGGDVVGGRDLGADGGFGIDPPQFAFVGRQAGAANEQFGHDGQLASTCGVLGAGGRCGSVDEFGIGKAGEPAGLRNRTIEHVFESTDLH